MIFIGICFYFRLCSIYFTFIHIDILYIYIRDKKAHSPQIQEQGTGKAGSKIRRYITPN